MSRQLFLIHVVVGILKNQDGLILVAQRPSHVIGGGLWEFPGGKVELNENAYSALKREFKEEIGIEILSAQHFFSNQHDYSDRVVLLDTWLIKEYRGIPCGAEGQIIRWVTIQALDQYTFPEGNVKIIEKLKEKTGTQS